MPVNRRTLIRSVGSTAAVSALAGCVNVSENTETPTSSGGGGTTEEDTPTGTPTPEPGTVSFWHARKKAGGEALAQSTSTFGEKTPHSVDLSEISSLNDKTKSAIPAGDGPHLFEWAHDWSGNYWENGFLSDQSDAVDVDLESTYTDVALDAVKYKGNLVGLPYAAETVSLMYNKSLVDSPPKTVSELKSQMESYHDPSNNKYGLSYPFNAYFVSGYVQAFGGMIFDPKTETTGLDQPETIKGLKFAIDNFTPYMPNDTGWGPQTSVFLDGRAPFAINGPWFLNSANKNDIDLGVVELPKPSGGEVNPFTGIKMWYFTKRLEDGAPENAQAARSLAEWYTTNTEILTSNAKNLGYIPVHQDVVARDDLGSVIDGFKNSVNKGMGMPVNPKMSDVWGPLGTAIGKAVNGDASAEDALTTAAKEIRSKWES